MLEHWRKQRRCCADARLRPRLVIPIPCLLQATATLTTPDTPGANYADAMDTLLFLHL